MNTLKNTFYLFILSVFIFSCKSDKTTSSDNNVDIALVREPAMINPFLNPISTSREVYQYIFTPMADFHPDTYELIPILLKSIPERKEVTEGKYKGATKYTLELRDEAVWDDGSPVTGEDYKFSIKAIKHPQTKAAGYRNYLTWISDVIVDPTNKKKFDVIFKEDYILAKELAVTMEVYPKYVYDSKNIMDNITISELNSDDVKSVIEGNQDLMDFAKEFNDVKFAREVVSGCGPYKLKEWITNQTIVLERKENYWGEGLDIHALKAGAEKLIFHIISDEAALASQLKEGALDVAKFRSANAFVELQNNEIYKDKFDFFTPELMSFYYVAINNSKPELSDPAVRQALAKLTDVNNLIKIMEDGLGNPTVGIFNAKKNYYNESLKPIELDVDGAATLLADNGWEDSDNDGSVDKTINGKLEELDLDLYITGSQLSKNLALTMQENAANADVKINIISKPFSEIRKEHLSTGDFDLVPLRLGQTLTLDDPYSKWHSEAIEVGSNDTRYSSSRADELIDKIRLEKNEKERNILYKELQQVMYEDQPAIFLYNPQEKLVVNKDWVGKSTQKRPGYFANTFVKR